ncbi:MAG TPA: OmpH family outer membrane protein [Saprospiraceae bacterium]|nr:OmpH family outer membrane protein [Saprospiraceae bacterium]
MKLNFRLAFTITLFYAIVMTSCKPNSNDVSSTSSARSGDGPSIVYINLDSLLEKYDLYTESRALLEEESRKAEQSIASRLETFQKRAYDFQRRVQETQQRADQLAPVQLQALEQKFAAEQQKLAKEEQDLVAKRDNAARGLEGKLIELQKNLKDKIDTHLEKISNERGYDFVLIKGNNAGVLYGRSSLDITDQTVKELNDLYKNSNEKPETIVNQVIKDTVQ